MGRINIGGGLIGVLLLVGMAVAEAGGWDIPKHNKKPPHHQYRPNIVQCTNKKYSFCCYRKHVCPPTCPQSCEIDCVTCKPICHCDKPGAVCQDPRFIGADGITFYFHGKKDRDFCLVADSNLHINAHFIGKRNHDMNRDFTWVQSLGILFGQHRVYVGARKTAPWNDDVDRLSLSFDGEPVFLPEADRATWNSSDGALTITRNTNNVEIEAMGKFKIKAVVVPITHEESLLHNYGINQDDDSFAHLDLSFKFHSLSSDVGGVLGQTYASTYVSRVKMGVNMPVLGGDDLFSSSSIFSTDCAVAKFSSNDAVAALEGSLQFPDLSCSTDVTTGQGVVCKR